MILFTNNSLKLLLRSLFLLNLSLQLHIFVYTFCNRNFYYFCYSFSHLNSYFLFSYSDDACENLLSVFSSARACLKKAFRELRVSVCGRFYPNEGGVAGYGNRTRVKSPAKWGLQIAEMIFQTRSRVCLSFSTSAGMSGRKERYQVSVSVMYFWRKCLLVQEAVLRLWRRSAPFTA